MGNRHISSFQPDVTKVSIYGSDLNQSIETNQKGVSITGILSLDAQDPLTTNILECPSLSIMDNLTLSLMDTSNITTNSVLEGDFDTFIFPTSSQTITLSSKLLSVQNINELWVWVFLYGGSNDPITANVFLAPIADKKTGVKYGTSKVLNRDLSIAGLQRVALFLVTERSNYVFVTLEGSTLTSEGTVGVFLTGRSY
ncbi:hypothetical protein [Turicibacter bilis]|uniref:hypothetical protein n=1 Tax=Turicibacter bilis TaxID=2735723 RepID=UPI003F894BE9